MTALTSSIIGQNNSVYQELLKGDGGVFSKFQWAPDPFSNADEEASQLRNAKELMQRTLHNDMPFRPTQAKKSLKYEFPFLRDGEIATRDFLMAEDPYAATLDERLRARWFEESKILYGSFTPAGPQKPIQTISKSKMKDIVDHLK